MRGDYQIEPVLEGGALASLRIVWRLDPITSMLAARGMDANRNGSLEPEELEAFARQNDRLLAANGYLLRLSLGERDIPFTVVAPLRARLEAGRIELAFEVQLGEPADPAELDVRFFDETWYVALHPAEPPLAGDAPCRASTHASVLATRGWGEQTGAVVRLDCTPPGSSRPEAWR